MFWTVDLVEQLEGPVVNAWLSFSNHQCLGSLNRRQNGRHASLLESHFGPCIQIDESYKRLEMSYQPLKMKSKFAM